VEETLAPLLLTLPWVGVLLYLRLVVRVPAELPFLHVDEASKKSFVSVIVPARNEADNIEACVQSLISAAYPEFEVVVVDDESEDGTGDLARALARTSTTPVRVIEGTPLPPGWLGKPWACWQGFTASRGDLLLFTDADTTHGRDLLGRAVSGLAEERADLLTVVGRQLTETFWERLVQPQIFLVMHFRFPRLGGRGEGDVSWRNAIANGQFLLFRREAYEKIGGHESVRDEVVEDLALAQHVRRAGLGLAIRSAERDLATRMYRSLGELVDGWSKNLLIGGLQSVPRWMRPLVPPLALFGGAGLWLVPPVVLLLALGGLGGPSVLLWSSVTCALSVLVWADFGARMGVSVLYAPVYPLGACVATFIFLRSWLRGRRVEWRGRSYVLPPVSGRP